MFVVPYLVGLELGMAMRIATYSGLRLGHLTDGADEASRLEFPLREGFFVVRQSPPSGTPAARWDPIVVEWGREPPDLAGVREPRRPIPPTDHAVVALEKPRWWQ